MRFTATITPKLLQTLGSTEDCSNKLLEVLENIFWSTTLLHNREQDIEVVLDEEFVVHIELDLNQRDAEVIKDMIYEAFSAFFDPEFASDIEVEINNEM
jgi:hypothetical protein